MNPTKLLQRNAKMASRVSKASEPEPFVVCTAFLTFGQQIGRDYTKHKNNTFHKSIEWT